MTDEMEKTEKTEETQSAEGKQESVEKPKPAVRDSGEFDPVRELLRAKEAEIKRLRKSRDRLRMKLKESRKPETDIAVSKPEAYNKVGASQRLFDLLRGKKHEEIIEKAD